MVFQTRSEFSLIASDSDRLGDAKYEGPIRAGNFRLAHQPFSPAFAAISLGGPGSSPMTRKDSDTGFEFPVELCHKSKPCPGLTGLGVRAKRILGLKNINIYALGIYVDNVAAKRQLAGRFKGVCEKDLSKDQALFDEVINGSFEKSLRLVISFGSLKRYQFIDALQERLEPRLKKDGEASTMAKFKSQFDDVVFRKGMEIVFVQDGHQNLVTKIDGAQRGAISSPSLYRSLFDIYLGQDPVSPDAKRTFGSNLATSLKK